MKLTAIGKPTEYTLGYAEANEDWVYPATFDSAAISVPPIGLVLTPIFCTHTAR